MLNVHVRKGETMERLHTRAYSDLLNDAIYTRRNTYTFTRIFVKMIRTCNSLQVQAFTQPVPTYKI